MARRGFEPLPSTTLLVEGLVGTTWTEFASAADWSYTAGTSTVTQRQGYGYTNSKTSSRATGTATMNVLAFNPTTSIQKAIDDAAEGNTPMNFRLTTVGRRFRAAGSNAQDTI